VGATPVQSVDVSSAALCQLVAHWCTIGVSVIFSKGLLVHHPVCRWSWMDRRCTRGGCWVIALLAWRCWRPAWVLRGPAVPRACRPSTGLCAS